MLLRNWLENLKTSCGLTSLRKARCRSPLRKLDFGPRFLAAEVCEERRLLSAGALDPTFGSGGTASPSTPVNGTAAAIAVYSNGQAGTAGDVVAAGTVTNNSGNHDFVVVRYTSNGHPDSSFGRNGTVATTLKSYGNDYLTDVAIQVDGKIVVAGWGAGMTVKGPSDDFLLVRYNANGSLDSGFGSNGLVATNFSGGTTATTGSLDIARAVLLQPDGKTVLAGVTAGATEHAGRDNKIALARYNADGTLDTSFGSGGKVTTSHTLIPGSLVDPKDGNTQVNDAALQADGKILVSGYTQVTGGLSPSIEVFVARYNSNGTLDTSFGTKGFVTLPPVNGDNSFIPTAGHVAVEPGGEIVVTGISQLALLHADGTFDTTFGGNNTGIVTQGYGPVSLEPNGDIVVSGYGWLNGTATPEITRFLPGGAVDTTFGTGGTVKLPDGFIGPAALAIQPDGKIDLALNTTIPDGKGGATPNGFMVDRLLPGAPQIGSLTTSTNSVTGGSNVTAIASNITDDNPGATISQVAITVEDSSGNIIIQGYATQSSTGIWTLTFSTSGWTPGTYTVLAQARDSYGVLGDPLTTSLTLL